jgi:hypothetical protein
MFSFCSLWSFFSGLTSTLIHPRFQFVPSCWLQNARSKGHQSKVVSILNVFQATQDQNRTCNGRDAYKWANDSEPDWKTQKRHPDNRPRALLSSSNSFASTGVKKVPGPLLSPGALDFMPISPSRVIRENHIRQTIIKIPVEIITKWNKLSSIFAVYERRYRRYMGKEEQRFMMKFLWLEGRGAKGIHEELMSTLGDDSYGVSQIKIWLQKFRNGDLSCKDSPRSGRPLLTLGHNLRRLCRSIHLPPPE